MIFCGVLRCFEMLCGVVSVKLKQLYGLFMYIHTMSRSRTLIGYLSPSLGLKFSDVPGGLAAISKVPAWSLENRESLTYNDIS